MIQGQTSAVACVTCPLCKSVSQVKKGAEHLPTNMYALNIVLLKNATRGSLAKASGNGK